MKYWFARVIALVGVSLAVVLFVACGSKAKIPDDMPDGDMTGDDSGLITQGDGSMNEGGGPKGCDPSCGLAGGMCVNDTCVIVDNPGKVTLQVQTQLENGGSADPSFKWLYPYDKTIFPRGLLPPTMQFAGAAWDAVYVHVTFPGMDYKGFYGAAPARVAMLSASWKAVTLAATGKPDETVAATKIAGGQVTGPTAETWTIAKGSLRGTIYYETYDSQLAGGLGSVGIMKIAPGASQPTVLKSGCGNVCHTASADGSTLVASQTLLSSASYDLKNNAAQIIAQGDERYTYGALYPNGSLSMSATHYRTWLQTPSRLYDTKTGMQIPASGWDGVITNGGTPAFSPDGKHIAFNHEDTGGGHTLAMMDFDINQKKFSALADIANGGGSTLAWPAFTPDSKWVVFHAGSNAQFETDNGATGDLYAVELSTKKTVRLDLADGFSNNQVYLPANDTNLSFAPTVLPEAVGGYFWVVFTSHRSYGNLLPSKDHNDEYGKLWVAAFDINATPGTDASHPAFFLDGQEAAADNLRGFWVLDPCKSDGSDCKSGDECCDGYCRPADGGNTCVPPPGGCSQEFEKCNTAADCCDKSSQCINGRCAQPPPN